MHERMRGFAPLIAILIIAAVIMIGSGATFYYAKKAQPTAGVQQNHGQLSDQNKTVETQQNQGRANGQNISTATKPLFGIMLAFNINDAIMGAQNAIQKGWTQFKKDDSAYQTLKSNLEKNIQDRTTLVKATNFSIDRELVPYFTWNIIEPSKGRFDWDLTDLYVEAAKNANIKISAVIQPFASWDQKNTVPLANCNALDFAYYDYKVGPPNDLAEYENFLTKTVERYKGKVGVWEIGNEYDGPCGGYENDPQGYFDLLKMTSETIKKADPKAIVTNGGASEMVGNGPGTASTKSFWTRFFTLGGGRYIDYFNFHYNTERSQNPTLDPTTLQEAVTFLNNLMDKNGDRKPLYLTEFGIYSGLPSSQPPAQAPRQAQILTPFNPSPQPLQPYNPSSQPPQSQSGATAPTQNVQSESETAQAALYFKDSIIAFAGGVHTILIDLRGPDGGMVGSSMAFNTNDQPRLFLTTLKTIQDKIGGFSNVDKIANGQYAFTVGGKTIYAVWSGTLPKEISDHVKVTDIKGHEQTMDAAKVTVSTDQPIFIESPN